MCILAEMWQVISPMVILSVGLVSAMVEGGIVVPRGGRGHGVVSTSSHDQPKVLSPHLQLLRQNNLPQRVHPEASGLGHALAHVCIEGALYPLTNPPGGRALSKSKCIYCLDYIHKVSSNVAHFTGSTYN